MITQALFRFSPPPPFRALGATAETSTLADGSEVYHVLDTTLIPAVVRVGACRKGLFAGQASFGRNVSKTKWIYGFKVALCVTPDGVVTSFGLAPANCDERPVGECLVASGGHDSFLADKGFFFVEWERYWLKTYGALVAATPQKIAKRSGQAVCWQQAHADSGSPIGESLDDRQRSTGHRYLDFARQACQKMPKTDFGPASYRCVRIGNNSKRHLPPFWVFG